MSKEYEDSDKKQYTVRKTYSKDDDNGDKDAEESGEADADKEDSTEPKEGHEDSKESGTEASEGGGE